MEKENIKNVLVENAREYQRNALESERKGDYNSAVTLFFKALAALCDIYIFKKENFIPSSHTERFRVLEMKYPDFYNVIDKDFSFYQESYTAKMNKETCEVLRNDVKKLFEIAI
ncbi:MAG: hypothetical protein KJ600_01980 [Nanoarchaeota archaeon]|nr:hypothetical protein [Nanoarchaeota archaeon]MBU1103305.1 hypothetical protein [Nanoarchaeota archaeon]